MLQFFLKEPCQTRKCIITELQTHETKIEIQEKIDKYKITVEGFNIFLPIIDKKLNLHKVRKKNLNTHY